MQLHAASRKRQNVSYVGGVFFKNLFTDLVQIELIASYLQDLLIRNSADFEINQRNSGRERGENQSIVNTHHLISFLSLD